MIGISETLVRRLRRISHALLDDADTADAIVVETITHFERRRTSPLAAIATLIAQRRAYDSRKVRVEVKGRHGEPDALRALRSLPLCDREVLALVIIDRMPYDDAASVLEFSRGELLERLTRAREHLARATEGARPVLLRVVK